MSIYQMCYASCATSAQDTLLDDLRNILNESRDFNVKHDLTGVLYFADGYFFQCLEGDLSTLDLLINKLKNDPRHKNFQLFNYQAIEQRNFVNWSMKYVQRNSAIQCYLREIGLETFKPKHLNSSQVGEIIHLLADIKI